MTDQEIDINNIYEELIELKDTLDKIKDICEVIIEYDLEKNPSTIDTNINLLKQDISDLGEIHIRDLENIEIRNEYTSEIHKLEHELSGYNKRISGLWLVYILHPRITLNKKSRVDNKKWNLIVKNTGIKLKISQLLKFYYEKTQRLLEIYETYQDQEHIEELLKVIDAETISIIYEHNQQEHIEVIDEKNEIIREKNEIIDLLKKRLENSNNNLVLLEDENSKLLDVQKSFLEKIRVLENKTVPTADLLDTSYNPFDNLE